MLSSLSCLLVIFCVILASVSDTESFEGNYVNVRYEPVTRNVDTKNTKACPTSKTLRIIALYDALTILINTGKSIQTSNQRNTVAILNGGPLDDTYIYLSFTYYFASNPTTSGVTGTTIDNKGFPYAVRISYINQKYETFEKALQHDDGLAELVFLFNICSVSTTKFDEISKKIQKIPKAGSFTPVLLNRHIDAVDFIPQNAQYYTYEGEFLDTETNKRYKSSKVIIFKPNWRNCITQAQFNRTFSHITNSKTKPLSSTLPHDSSELQTSLCRGTLQVPNPM